MKRLLLIALGLLLFASAASAQFVYINITMPHSVGLTPAVVPPIMTYRWESRGQPPGQPPVAEVRWILEPVAYHDDSFEATIDWIRSNPDAPWWSDWQTIDPPDSGTSWTTPPTDFGLYVFAIHGRDSTGNTNWVFDEAYNVRRILVSSRTGPLLTVTGDHIDPISFRGTTTPLTQIELVYGTPVSFCWTADASDYGGMTVAYHYGWDITDFEDLSQWDILWTPISDGEEQCSPVVVYDSGVHTFYVEVHDSYGFLTRIPIKITYGPEPPPPGGSIGIFSDAGAAGCNLFDDAGPQMLDVYVVHIGHFGADAAWFSAPAPDCFSTAVHLSDTAVFPATTGDSQTGVEIYYTRCESAPVHVLTIHYFVEGLTQSCCYYPVLPHSDHANIEVKACGTQIYAATSGVGIINPTNECNCSVAVKEATWGKIKALYR